MKQTTKSSRSPLKPAQPIKKAPLSPPSPAFIKPKIWLVAGHWAEDTGAVANGYVESKLTIQLRDLILKQFDNTWTVFIDDERNNLSKVVSWLMANATKDDYIVDIHFNAGSETATGTEVFVSDNATQKEKQLAKDVAGAIADILGIRNRGVKTESQSARGKLAIFRPYGNKILIEVCFITNKKDMELYQQAKTDVAKVVAAILKQYALAA